MNYINLDYTITDPKEREKLVEKIVAETPPGQLTQSNIEHMSDYIIDAVTKKEKKSKEIITNNRMVTVNKRETSYEGLVEKFENGEDGVYNLFSNNKGVLLTPKIEITDADIEEIPDLAELRLAIKDVEDEMNHATGRRKFNLKKQLIEMHRDQYVIKSAYKPVVGITKVKPAAYDHHIDFSEEIYMDENDEPVSRGLVSLFNPDHVSILMHKYADLRQERGRDLQYILDDLDKLIADTLKEKYPLYFDLVQMKIEKKSNTSIQRALESTYGIKHSVEYLSSLWCNKIPKMLADKAQENYIIHYYTEEKRGVWKKCSRCGEIKLAHNRFFSRNSTSKDGFYSICKECRNKKAKERRL